MSSWPSYVRYTERLLPDTPAVDVELCQSRNDVFDLLATLNRLAVSDPIAWRLAVRQHTATDWYVMAMYLSGAQRMDPFTGRTEWDNDFHLNWIRECQFDSDNTIDKSAREHGKTSIRCYVGVTVEIVNDPDLTVGIFSFEKAAAERSGRRLKDEWATNVELKAIWDDVFYDNADREAPLWSMEKGLVVKRRIVGATPSVGWYSILELPVGSRLGLGILDDVETEKTSSTEEMRDQTMDRVNNCFNLGGRACRWWVNGTHHHTQGVIARLEKTGGWRVRCHKAEDTTLPAPDIAALYDACGGVLPVRGDSTKHITLPPATRNVRLAGKPVYLHPLECALKRLRMGNETYERQNQGDALAGQDRRLNSQWIRRYTGSPRRWAAGANLYITIDPSKGGDPTSARVDAAKSDETLSWVGGLRRKLAPSQFAPAIYTLAMEWVGVGNLIEIRVEEFGQSTWGFHLRQYFNEMNRYVCRIISCARHNTLNKESSGRQREWTGLEPAYRLGKRLWPEAGIRVTGDDKDDVFDLCEYYLENEYTPFPLSNTDDGLAADYLLCVTKGKGEDGKDIDLAIEYPDSDEEGERAERSSGLLRRHRREPYGDDSWMMDA